jgi:hypothetical protein
LFTSPARCSSSRQPAIHSIDSWPSCSRTPHRHPASAATVLYLSITSP